MCVCVTVRDRWEEIDGPIWVDDSVTAMIRCLRVCLIKSDTFFHPSLPTTLLTPLQFLIEVKNSLSSIVPPDWVKISR